MVKEIAMWWRRRRRTPLEEEEIVVAAGPDEPLLVIFEPMGFEHEIPAGEHVTVRFTILRGEGGLVDYREDYASIWPGPSGEVFAWTASGEEIEL
ncbi:hypothetical protein [Kitasatospora sp. NPDC101183]|uniref:hypothetical protein n=1 Tax=Kitasatospora sp. NPDC101183 TaxID=3364100 RepID=UPI0038233772